ncbi:Flp family type IVb pilin [Desulfonatronum lacustre]|uniref:Flp family type IVb pilin n=1 Tax=Desulfonatronum lacustre TaxID=66849 RepID=UPI0004902F29|nr:Flp family type IVb pilin [Desulfonatronum lacustre]
MEKLMNFLKDEEGATMVEYGLLVALISIAAIAFLITIGPKIEAAFEEVDTALTP